MKSNNMNQNQAKTLLKQAWWIGVNAVNGYDLVAKELVADRYSSVTHVVAIGKAASSMMLAVHDHIRSFRGLVISKYDHVDDRLQLIENIEVIESAHPVPDENSLIAGRRLFSFVSSLGAGDNLLMLVSGGASSLAEKLPDLMNLRDLQSLNEKMLSEQRTIAQINSKRSEISMIKRAKLLNQCKANSITSLAISDVQGDDIKVIGSGIGACDLVNSTQKIIGSNKVARQAIKKYFADNNIAIICENESLYGDLYQAAEKIAGTIEKGETGVYIFGGEPIIELPENPGEGGRNQSLALAIAKEIYGHSNIVVLVAGSDGTDGPTDAAGGLIDSETFENVVSAQNALCQANAGAYLREVNGLFVSGPTATNVMDLLIAIKLQK